MRNDARLIGEDSPASPVGGHETPLASDRPDSRDPHKDARQSHGVNQTAEDRQPDSPKDSVTPS
jgi:hypothetical protein